MTIVLSDPPKTKKLLFDNNRSFSKNWIDSQLYDEIKNSKIVKSILKKSCEGIDNSKTVENIQKSCFHILSRCENPKNWKEKKRGLVVGMVQSGKTVSMLNTSSIAMAAGYGLFIILAGDKNSLRCQTQERFEVAFSDQKSTRFITNEKNDVSGFLTEHNYDLKNFLHQHIKFSKTVGESPKFIAVIKKEVSQLRAINNVINQLKIVCKKENINFNKSFPCLLIDDESDYASINTANFKEDGYKKDEDSTETFFQIDKLYKSIENCCYLAYTATPQACLLANKDDFNYPKNFIWLLEPTYLDSEQKKTASYMGGVEFFHPEPYHQKEIIRIAAKNSWPHYIKNDNTGKTEYIQHPTKGKIRTTALDKHELDFAKDLNNDPRKIPESFKQAICDFLISCGMRWYQYFIVNQKNNLKDISNLDEAKIENLDFPFHAMMINLSTKKETHKFIRLFFEKGFDQLCENDFQELAKNWDKLSIEMIKKMGGNRFAKSILDFWSENNFQKNREPEKNKLQGVLILVQLAIKITKKNNLDSNNFIYVINSDEDTLKYSKKSINRTKKCAIIIGGAILSRGLTIEGLCTSIYIRSTKEANQDTSLQMCRWFGHKKKYLNFLRLYTIKENLRLFQDVSESDLDLRTNLKNLITEGSSPNEVLIKMRSSPFFRNTSKQKSRYSNDTKGSNFSGTAKIQTEPIFDEKIILNNKKAINELISDVDKKNISCNHLNRGVLYKDIDYHKFINFLEDFTDKPNAYKVSCKEFKNYLILWAKEKAVPKINVGFMKRTNAQRSFLPELCPDKHFISDAKKFAENRFENFYGGSKITNDLYYKGDKFFDFEESFHKKNYNKEEYNLLIENTREDILFLIYSFNPNYITQKKLRNNQAQNKIYLNSEDKGYINLKEIYTFLVCTPFGGPNFSVTFNKTI